VPPTSRGDVSELGRIRARCADGPPLGTMPPLPEADADVVPLLDRLGGRLAYERLGARLYDALIARVDHGDRWDGGPTREELLRLRTDEQRHARTLDALIAELGGDPTCVTPCADLELTATRGLALVVTDPRATLFDGLDAMIAAELADHERWAELVAEAEALGRAELARRLALCQGSEADHVDRVRGWLRAGHAARRRHRAFTH
jgi:rubrerythrin